MPPHRERALRQADVPSDTPVTDADLALAALARADAFSDKAKKLAETAPPRRRMAFAQSFCRHLVETYWAKKAPASPRSLRQCPASTETPKREALELAEAFGLGVAQVDADRASYVIGRTYAAMLPDEYRSANGVFYTPPPVVNRLLASVEAAGVDWKTARVLEPACGGGAFLGPIARRMARALQGADPRMMARSIRSRLSGYEIDPFAAWLSAVFLDAALEEEVGLTSAEELAAITVCDSLSQRTDDTFDLVIANPPYGRVGLTPDLRAAFKRSLYGHANLYGLFLDLAVRKTKAGGVIAYVTPTGFLCGEYFKRLRALLAAEAPPLALDFISERSGVFDDVLQETLLALFRRDAVRATLQVRFVDVAQSGTKATVADSATLPEPPERPWIVARQSEAGPLAQRLRSMPTRLADWGYQVSTGPLVWNRYKAQLRNAAEPGAVPLVWAEAVGADGTFEFRAARRNHAPYFLPVAGEDDWLLVRRPSVLLQRTTAKEQSRRLIAAELPSSFLARHGAITVENHLNMVVPCVPEPSVGARAVAAFLNSAAADRAFRCISGTVAVSAYELEAMPLPPAWAMRELQAQLGPSASQAQWDAALARLYGEW